MTSDRVHTGGRDIVAIGSSAGGLHALMAVLAAFPAGFPASILAVQHLDPKRPSHMAGILARHCQVRVVEAQDSDPIETSTIYIAPPNKHMLVDRKHIHLTQTELVHFVRPSIDLLFESVAAVYGSRTIGVILTGSGIDGALGVRAIKERGGLTIVQSPETAESSGMPKAAIATGAIDVILPLEKIGKAIVDAVVSEEDLARDNH